MKPTKPTASQIKSVRDNVEAVGIYDVVLGQKREIKRLRRALREIKEIFHKEYDARCERHVKVTCYCPRCLCCRIATRALKGKR